jgi:hypothetical protein
MLRYAVYTNINNYPPAQHIIEINEMEPPPILNSMKEFILDFTFYSYNLEEERDMHFFRYILLNQTDAYPYNIIEFKEPFAMDIYFENSIRLLLKRSQDRGSVTLRMYKTTGCCNYLENNIFLTLDDRPPPSEYCWYELYESPFYVRARLFIN